jgi:hypothetical protein
MAGDEAWARYTADYDGYDDGSHPIYDMFVDMSGSTPLNGFVHSTTSYWERMDNGLADLAGLAGLLAHEEMHHDGYTHADDDALISAKQNTCTV